MKDWSRWKRKWKRSCFKRKWWNIRSKWKRRSRSRPIKWWV